ncbi:hypothetical protein [Streptomyces avermitilis]|uniref:hypothetical protein n=1 Tax=Streptomyces avermitilis TaxID=33903 RepID=UPI0036D0775D
MEARLLRAEQDCELQESIVQEDRPELPDGQPAPLTSTQLDDLLGERSSRTRVVLGTSATGVTDVARTLRTIAGPIDGWALPAALVGRAGEDRPRSPARHGFVLHLRPLSMTPRM